MTELHARSEVRGPLRRLRAPGRLAMAHGAGDGRGKIGDGGENGPPLLNARMCAALLNSPELLPLLANPPRLALVMRRWGYDVPRLPMRNTIYLNQLLARTRDLWSDEWLQHWLPRLLDPETPPLVQQLMAELVAARSDETLCWGAGVPTRRQQRARARALLRAAAAANVSDTRAPEAQAWWNPGWHPPRGLRHRPWPELLDWFVRHVRRTLQGQVTSRTRQREQQPEAPAAPAAPAAPKRRLRMRKSKRPRTTPQAGRRR